MDVADPADFVSTANKAANELVVAKAIAALLSVQESAVTVTLTLGTRARRLAASVLRRLTTTYVIATSEITVADEAAANTLKTAADAVTPTAMTTQVAAKLVESGRFTQAQVDALNLTVTSASAAVVLPAGTASGASTSTGTTASGTASGAIKTSFSVASPFAAVFAWLLLSNV